MPATSDLLRLATAGSVDDGKSTLIGRLLHDAKAILSDQLEDLRSRDGALDLARLTDGLRAEREQGITIDVAWRFFATPRRTFILADTPGHAQYTRNMVTGASTADVAIILVDAGRGVAEQTRRHAFIAALLGVPHLVVAVNKMDLVGYSEERFDAICAEMCELQARLGVHDLAFIPLSALHGDNVVDRSEAMAWYGGLPLLAHLEGIEVEADRPRALRFPVQLVLRGEGERLLAGRVAGGTVRPGDEIVALPSGMATQVAAVESHGRALESATAPLSVALRLADEIDVGRGDLLCRPGERPVVVRELEADLCWMAEAPLRAGGRYGIKHTTRSTRAVVDAVLDRVDVATLAREQAPPELALNDIGRVRLRTAQPLAVDPYAANRTTGAFILIDEATNDTVAAGMVAG